MENKINIAEMLRNCPKGMELYSPIFGEVYLDKIRPYLAIVVTTDKEQGDFKEEFLYDGRYGMNGECMLFPSKDKTTWEGFHRPFRDGDIITCNNSACTFVSIFKDKPIERSFRKHCSFILDYNRFVVTTEFADYTNPRFATEEEKAKLFQAIEDNGYKWNAETKTLEELLKFKDGDILTTNLGSVFILKEPNENVLYYSCYVALSDVSRFIITSYTKFCNKNGCCLATEEEKQKLFDAIKANGYHWNPETKKLEKLIESKEDTDDGLVMSKEDRHDEIVMSGIYFDREYYADEVELHLGNYEIEVRDGKTYAVFKNQETKISKPNFKVENKIKKKSLDNPIEITSVIPKMYNTFKDGSFQHVEIIDEDYELALDKFDITTLKPFESRVLVRDDNYDKWEADIFGRYSNGYITLGGIKWKQCIPFEGNEHLLGTTDDCDEFFKF